MSSTRDDSKDARPPQGGGLRAMGLMPMLLSIWLLSLMLAVGATLIASIWTLAAEKEEGLRRDARTMMNVIAAGAAISSRDGEMDRIDAFVRGVGESADILRVSLWHKGRQVLFASDIPWAHAANQPVHPVAQAAYRTGSDAIGGSDGLIVKARPIVDGGELLGVVSVEIRRPRRIEMLTMLLSETAWIGAAVLSVLACLAALVARLLVRPVEAATKVADRIASGDLTPEIRIGGSREARRLGRALRRMTQTLRQNVARMDDLANRDSLTDLPNRAAFTRRASDRIRLLGAERRGCAVMFIDLDGFKQINDTHGHAEGDRLLRAFSKRLAKTIRETDRILSRPRGAMDDDLVGRLGGDEFTVLLSDIHDRTAAEAVARRLLRAIEPGFDIGMRRLRIGASIGIAMMPATPVPLERLLRAADDAMYEVKRGGRNGFRIVDLAA